MRFEQTPIITNGDMSGNINSQGMDFNQIMLYSVQAVWTGTPSGILKLQLSNDIVNPVIGSIGQANEVVNWTDYTGSPQTLSGSAGNFVWNCIYPGYRWMRLVYTASSSSGTLNVIVSAKGA